jgi:hypothetical protein
MPSSDMFLVSINENISRLSNDIGRVEGNSRLTNTLLEKIIELQQEQLKILEKLAAADATTTEP